MMYSQSTYENTLREARSLQSREAIVQWMIAAPDKIALREQIGRIVLTEWDQKETRAFHADEMEKNRAMHRQTQWMAFFGIVLGLVVALPEACSHLWNKAKSLEAAPAPTQTTSPAPSEPDASQGGGASIAKESAPSAKNQSAEPPKKAEE